jgi:hypothetical protein
MVQVTNIFKPIFVTFGRIGTKYPGGIRTRFYKYVNGVSYKYM